MGQKHAVCRTTLDEDAARQQVEAGIRDWKMGRVFGFRRVGDAMHEATRAGKQTGSIVAYEIQQNGGESTVTVRLETIQWAIKNPMTGVFGSIEKSIRSSDPSVQRS